MHTEIKLTTNHKHMQGCVMKMKKINKKDKMTVHNILYSKRSRLIDDYKSQWEQIRTKLAASKHHTTKVFILY